MTGTTLSHYRVMERIGEGATSVVYKAEDLALGRPVALKLLPPALSVDLGKVARFQHEARTTSTLNHPNICTIYEIDQHEGRHFIAMEFLEGQSLSTLLGGRAMECYRLVELGIQIADGLEAAHSERVIHRDLKPANIYVTYRDHVKILDFGLAVLMPFGTGSRTPSSATWLAEPGGTVPYMSPEQTLGEQLDTEVGSLLSRCRALRDGNGRAPVHRRDECGPDGCHSAGDRVPRARPEYGSSGRAQSHHRKGPREEPKAPISDCVRRLRRLATPEA